MSHDDRDLWHELGIIGAIYVACVIAYTIVMWNVYGQATGADVKELMKLIPEFLKEDMGIKDKVKLVVLLLSVVIYTFPLTVSCAFIAFNACSGGLSLVTFICCVVIPFFIYFWIFNNDVVNNQFHGLPQSGSQWLSMTLGILYYYIMTFKIQTVGSALVGGWAGYRVHEVLE